MININEQLKLDKLKVAHTPSKGIATVIEVSPSGVKIQLATETTPRDTFYNSLDVCTVGGKVIYETLDTDLYILGQFKY